MYHLYRHLKLIVFSSLTYSYYNYVLYEEPALQVVSKSRSIIFLLSSIGRLIISRGLYIPVPYLFVVAGRNLAYLKISMPTNDNNITLINKVDRKVMFLSGIFMRICSYNQKNLQGIQSIQ